MILYQDCSKHLDWSKNMSARRRGLFSLYIYIEKFKNLLVRNHWTDFNIILQKCAFGNPLPRLLKPFGFIKNMAARGRGLFSLSIYIEIFKKNFLSDTTRPISIKFCRNVPLVILYQDCSRHLDSSKNMAARGRGLFSLYIYIENFKKSSCQKPLDRFQYNFVEMFHWLFSTKIVQAIWIRQKTWPPGGGAYFPYIST